MEFWCFQKLYIVAITFAKLEVASRKFLRKQNNIQQCLIQSFVTICKMVQILWVFEFVQFFTALISENIEWTSWKFIVPT